MKKGLRAKDVVRCAGCGRLVERRLAKRGPRGELFGSDCYARAVRTYEETKT